MPPAPPWRHRLPGQDTSAVKTLFLYSGQARTIRHLHENHWFRVIRHFHDPHIVVSVADDEQAEDMRLLEQYVGKNKFRFEKVVQPTLPEPPSKSPYAAGYPTISSPQAVLRQFWHWKRVWEFAGDKKPFDCFVRIRPDSCFFECEPMVSSSAETIYTPWWGRWGGMNDRFAIMGKDCAGLYHGIYDSLESLFKKGIPLHPESLLFEQMRFVKLNLLARSIYFSPLRLPDEKHAGPWLDQLQISPTDLAEFQASNAGAR
jgi:hypothetical protein